MENNLGAIIDGTFEGLMTVVYMFYYEKFTPIEICESDRFQQSLLTDYVIVKTDAEKAAKVIGGIKAKLPPAAWDYIFLAFMSPDQAKHISIFKYIILGFRLGKDLDRYENLDYVLTVHKLSKFAGGEAHLLKGFVRFTKTKDGIFYADISPKNNVLPLLAEHFADRLCDERFIIHDIPRGLAAIYNTQEWVIVNAPENTSFELEKNEEEFQELWTAFYNTIAIKERANKKLRRSLMPKRYWEHVTEHKLKYPMNKE